MKRVVLLAFALCPVAACDRPNAAETGPSPSGRPAAAPAAAQTLVQARRDLVTRLVDRGLGQTPLEEPPGRVFRKVEYASEVGALPAYLTPDPRDGKKHPAIVWITGGDCNTIGDVWSPAPPENDQSASAYRNAGVVMMFPSMRGGNQNPGRREGFLGEVNDVLAAAAFLEKQEFVDPGRIYLGGHSTGGTLALLVAECSDRFRAVFAFGPADDVSGYPLELLPFDVSDPREIAVRSPLWWLDDIRSPTFVFEGTAGNIESLHAMKRRTNNPKVKFLAVPGMDHFEVLAPVNRLLASKILGDDGETCNIVVDDGELSRLGR